MQYQNRMHILQKDQDWLCILAWRDDILPLPVYIAHAHNLLLLESHSNRVSAQNALHQASTETHTVQPSCLKPNQATSRIARRRRRKDPLDTSSVAHKVARIERRRVRLLMLLNIQRRRVRIVRVAFRRFAVHVLQLLRWRRGLQPVRWLSVAVARCGQERAVGCGAGRTRA